MERLSPSSSPQEDTYSSGSSRSRPFNQDEYFENIARKSILFHRDNTRIDEFINKIHNNDSVSVSDSDSVISNMKVKRLRLILQKKPKERTQLEIDQILPYTRNIKLFNDQDQEVDIKEESIRIISE